MDINIDKVDRFYNYVVNRKLYDMFFTVIEDNNFLSTEEYYIFPKQLECYKIHEFCFLLKKWVYEERDIILVTYMQSNNEFICADKNIYVSGRTVVSSSEQQAIIDMAELILKQDIKNKKRTTLLEDIQSIDKSNWGER